MEEQESRDQGPGVDGPAADPTPEIPTSGPKESEAAEALPTGPEPSEAEIYRNRWIRVSADLDNLRKRIDRDIGVARREERRKIIRDFLGVLDNLERALDLAGPQPSEWLEGVEATRRQMLDLLKRHGVEPVESLGTRFDPTRHEAVTVVALPDEPDAQVVVVIQRGYLLDGELLRAARVVVNGRPD